MYKILIIEDDEKLRNLTRENLERYDYQVSIIEDFRKVEQQLAELKPDLVILDINLPYYDGFYLCRLIRKKSKVPIIIISARSGDLEQVMGIELGADDYVTKPFSSELLLAKVKSALRRAYGEYTINKDQQLSVKGLVLNPDSFKMSYKGLELELSKNEFKLLKKLLENGGKIVSRENLLVELWDDSSFVDDNTLTVNVTRVKQKCEELGIRSAIKTKRGVGYSFNPEALKGVDNE